MEQAGPERSGIRILGGAACVALAWFLFSVHDASVKLLVAGLSVWQVLFVRSAIIVPVCFLVNSRQSLTGVLAPGIWLRILFAALVYACASLAYYSAARHLQLVELETIYFASPLIATLLAVMLLGERVPLERWLALLIGLGGVTIACGPAGSAEPGPVALALLAAALWAFAVVLIRQLALSVPTSAQMLANNAVFLVMCGMAMPWWWQWPTRRDLLLLLLVGSGGMLAQYLLYEGIRRAPASVTSPLEFTGLLWSFWLGMLVFGDLPGPSVVLGMVLIVVSGGLVIHSELRERRGSVPSRTAAPADTELEAADLR